MRTTRIWITLGCGFVWLATLAQAESKHQPGLWETTTSMSFGGASMPQTLQLPPGVQMPQGGMSAPHTTEVCVTQAMIDKYGSPYSNPSHGDCHLTNLSLKPDGMTANLVCTGQMTANGTVDTTWTEPGTTLTKVHMTGTMQMGSSPHPMDITVQSRSVYKGADCGSVKPLPMPVDK